MAKPKRPKPGGGGPNDADGAGAGSSADYLEDMPLAAALARDDAAALPSIIASALSGTNGRPAAAAAVSDVRVERSGGEAYTGGRSAPVYSISCTVRRPGKTTVPRRRNFVAKLVVVAGDASSDARVAARRESYAVERRFYGGEAAARVRGGGEGAGGGRCGAGLAIPRLLFSDRDGTRPWPAVCLLMTDLRHHGYPRHPDFLSGDEAARALRWLASFHAAFWADGPGETWRRDLWDRGGFWTGGKGGGGGGGGTAASQWSRTVRWMQTTHPELVTAATKGLGRRIQAAAGPVANFLSKESRGARGTLIHGDYKAANLFFADVRDEVSGAQGEDAGAESVAALDFQFSGAGLGAEDVAYLLFPDARGHYFDQEDSLLGVYHEELVSSLIERRKGGPSSLALEALVGYYELSRLDLARHLLERGWVGSTKGDARLVSALEATLSRIDNGSVLASEDEYEERLAHMVGSA